MSVQQGVVVVVGMGTKAMGGILLKVAALRIAWSRGTLSVPRACGCCMIVVLKPRGRHAQHVRVCAYVLQGQLLPVQCEG